ncbi:CAP domain-containing protein [Streptomyces sp. NPDC006339]|uniref:CAP domain-containing protein n=1 Tax=Streptomyces sp. NPDC006339 TaxID=3156755 RepID=UPI0033BF06FB
MGRHRGARRGAPVRTGLLGVSAAVAVGAMAVASGLLPGGDTFTIGSTGTGGQRTEAQQAPSLTTQGGSSADPARTGDGTPSGAGRATPPPPSAKPSATPSTKPVPKPSATKAKPSSAPSSKPAPEVTKTTKTPESEPTRTARPTRAPAVEAPVSSPSAVTRSLAGRATAAEAEVVRLVNVERAQVGCAPVRSDAGLAALAGAFSADMAARDFFHHIDPDGATPWSRAAKAGITNLGAENIARGQVDAVAVMKSWMASDGHRANILNCDYKELGVGVHFADGGPWWTQDFGF